MTSIFYDRFLLSHQNTNQFWCKRELKSRSFIQLLETLLIELN